MKAIGLATYSSHLKLRPIEFERHEARPNEVEIEILYCGVCHSDIHQARNEWKNTVFPCMPGHEIIGRVSKIGANVTKHKEGDIVGVGCMVDSCHECNNCKEGIENYCEKGFLGTYNGNVRIPSKDNNTYGGYSTKIVVREDFVLKVPKTLDLKAAAPILCAGVTTYSPLKYWNVGPGVKVGIIGFGGLGHIAAKIAIAMGAEVTIISSSPEKKDDAFAIGALTFIDENDKDDMKQHERSLDFILSTIPETHDVNPHFPLLKTDGVLTIVGCLNPLKKPLDMSQLIMDRRTLSSSCIGSIAETQEVLNFCAKHKIAPDVRVINADQVVDAWDAVNDKSADFRYVIDMQTLKEIKEVDSDPSETVKQ